MNEFTFHLRSNKNRNTVTISVYPCFLLLKGVSKHATSFTTLKVGYYCIRCSIN